MDWLQKGAGRRGRDVKRSGVMRETKRGEFGRGVTVSWRMVLTFSCTRQKGDDCSYAPFNILYSANKPRPSL